MKGERGSRNPAEMIKERYMGKEVCEIDFDTQGDAVERVGVEAWNERVGAQRRVGSSFCRV